MFNIFFPIGSAARKPASSEIANPKPEFVISIAFVETIALFDT